MSHPSSLVIAVVGATGAVGAELITCLQRSDLPIGRLRLFASARSAGRSLPFRGTSIPVEPLTVDAFHDTDFALFSAGSAASRQFAPSAIDSGAVVIDNSSAFRMKDSVPLVVPEVNAHVLQRGDQLIANPNCVAIIASLALWPLHQAFGLRRVIASTYQAASGAGAAAMEELREATRAALAGTAYPPKVMRHPYAFNLFSHDATVDTATGANEEETKITCELRKIMALPRLAIGVTCIRVPVLRAHAISLTLGFEQVVEVSEARSVLQSAAGVRIVDRAADNHFPMPIEASGRDEVLVGRIRRDPSDETGRSLNLFVVGDQLLKGAALNAVQIAQSMCYR